MSHRLIVVTGMLLFPFTSLYAAELTIPAEDVILSDLRMEHPRLFITRDEVEQLRSRCEQNDEARRLFVQLQKDAEQLLSKPPVDYRIPDGKRLLAVSRAAKERVLLLGLMHLLSDDKRWVDRLWLELDTVTRFKDWNPSHFLDTAEMTFAVAVGYDWLYDRWTPQQRAQLQGAIVRLGLQPGLPTYEKQTWWARAVHNWNQVCNGGLAVGALAIADDEPELARYVLHAALTSVPRAMHEFGPDGGWGEGPGYWRYATEYNVYLLACLKTALGTDFGLSRLPGFSQTGDFPIYFVGPTGLTFNYADAHSSWHGAPQLFWLAREFNQPAWAGHQQQFALARCSPLDLLWGAGWLARGGEPDAPPLDRHFQGVQVAFLRSAWNDRDATFIGVKGGDNRVNHGHLDLGTFVLDALGERWFGDLGADNYNLPGYFGARRWNFYRCRAEGHNTLVLNPVEGPDQNPRAVAPIVGFDSSPGRSFAVIDLSAAYEEAARRVRRGIALLDRRNVLIQDEISSQSPCDAWWFAHTGADVALDNSGRLATLRQNGKTLHARLIEPADAAFELVDAAPLVTSPQVEGQADNRRRPQAVRKLAIHVNGQTELRFIVLVAPTSDVEHSPVPLDKW